MSSNVIKVDWKDHSTSPPRMRVLIIGAGPAGAAAKEHLFRTAITAGFTKSLHVITVESRPPAEDGMGVAWSQRRDSLKCNMPLPTVWVDPRQTTEFSEALGLQWDRRYSDLFPPRYKIGDLLHQRSLAADALAFQAGIAYDRIQARVTGLAEYGASFMARLGDDSLIQADAVIAAIGNLPSTQYSGFVGNPSFINHAWEPDTWLSNVAADATVGILGSSVTAIDAAISLLKNGHLGKIVMISNGGKLPGCRGRHEPGYKLQVVDAGLLRHLRGASDSGRLSFGEIIKLIRAEFVAAGVPNADLEEVFAASNLPPQAWLGFGLERANEPAPYFRVIKALDDLVPDLWDALDDRGRRKYIRHFHSDYARVAWPMAPENAEIVHGMLASRKLSVLGGLDTCLSTDGGFMVSLKSGEMVLADVVINASGIGGSIAEMDDPLLDNLLAQGLIHPHAFGGGLTDFQTGRLLNPSGEPTGALWATAGALSRGDRLLTNVLSEAGMSGIRTAEAVLGHLGLLRASAA